MILGMALFLALGALALAGALILVIAVVMMLRSRLRKFGVIVLAIGAAGAASSALAFTLLQTALGADSSVVIEALVLFAAAGFGAAGSIGLLAVLLLGVVGQPTRWSHRRRANA